MGDGTIVSVSAVEMRILEIRRVRGLLGTALSAMYEVLRLARWFPTRLLHLRCQIGTSSWIRLSGTAAATL